MKRLMLGILLLALVMPVIATNLNFQNPGDLAFIAPCSAGGTCTQYQSSTGLNNYYLVKNNPTDMYGGLTNTLPSSTTYAAATWVIPQTGFVSWTIVALYDSSGIMDSDHQLFSCNDHTPPLTPTRIEIKISQSVAYCYQNGVLFQKSGVMAASPSYITFVGQWASVNDPSPWDDYVYGSTENKYVLGLPESDDMFILLKDQSNPAASGLAFGVNNTIVQSQFLTGTWSRGSAAVPPEPLANETIHLVNYDTGTAYATNYTGTAYTGDVTIDMQTQLFNAGAPYGRYALTIDGSGQYSNVLIYRGTGATIAFDKDEYQPGDTANMTYTIDGPYWSGTNTYRVDIVSGTTGAVIHTQGISLQSGTDTYEFTSDNPQGVYYAVVIANDGTNDIWMGLDYTELNPYLAFTGYVNDENGVVLSGANVNITQNSIVTNSTTIADGNYTATGFYNGASTLLNITKPGYTQYYASLIPPVAKLIPLNFTLVNSTPTYTGLGTGGVARDGILTGIAITFGYGRPISGATVHVVNTTNGEHYTKTTNTAGYYLCDEGASCFLTTKRPYDVWGEKLGFDNSPNYTAVAA